MKLYRMQAKGKAKEFVLQKDKYEMIKVESIDDVKPGELYYIKPTPAPAFYETVFDSKQHIDQINELLNAGYIWQRKN